VSQDKVNDEINEGIKREKISGTAEEMMFHRVIESANAE